jgi:hypothetical protein
MAQQSSGVLWRVASFVLYNFISVGINDDELIFLK